MLNILSVVAVGAMLVLSGGLAEAQQPKDKAKCLPYNVCMQKCAAQGGRQCKLYCDTRPTC